MTTYSVVLIILATGILLSGVVLQLWGMRVIIRQAGDEHIALLRSDPDAPMSQRAWWVGGIIVMGLGNSLLAGEKLLPWWAVIALYIVLVFLTVVVPVLIHNKRVANA